MIKPMKEVDASYNKMIPIYAYIKGPTGQLHFHMFPLAQSV